MPKIGIAPEANPEANIANQTSTANKTTWFSLFSVSNIFKIQISPSSIDNISDTTTPASTSTSSPRSSLVLPFDIDLDDNREDPMIHLMNEYHTFIALNPNAKAENLIDLTSTQLSLTILNNVLLFLDKISSTQEDDEAYQNCKKQLHDMYAVITEEMSTWKKRPFSIRLQIEQYDKKIKSLIKKFKPVIAGDKSCLLTYFYISILTDMSKECLLNENAQNIEKSIAANFYMTNRRKAALNLASSLYTKYQASFISPKNEEFSDIYTTLKMASQLRNSRLQRKKNAIITYETISSETAAIALQKLQRLSLVCLQGIIHSSNNYFKYLPVANIQERKKLLLDKIYDNDPESFTIVAEYIDDSFFKALCESFAFKDETVLTFFNCSSECSTEQQISAEHDLMLRIQQEINCLDAIQTTTIVSDNVALQSEQAVTPVINELDFNLSDNGSDAAFEYEDSDDDVTAAVVVATVNPARSRSRSNSNSTLSNKDYYETNKESESPNTMERDSSPIQNDADAIEEEEEESSKALPIKYSLMPDWFFSTSITRKKMLPKIEVEQHSSPSQKRNSFLTWSSSQTAQRPGTSKVIPTEEPLESLILG